MDEYEGMLEKCYVCKEEMYILYKGLYVYRLYKNRKMIYFCSWNCKRKYEKARLKNRK